MRRHEIIDAHCDTVGLFSLERESYDFASRNQVGHIDLPRLREAGVKVQVFALYVKEEHKPVGALRYCLYLLENYYNAVEHLAESVQTIHTKTDLAEIMENNKTGALLSIEGGEALEGEPAVLRILFRLGVRALGLTWNWKNDLAAGVKEKDPGEGLTGFGKKVLKEMNKLGMLVDLAHINEKSFYEAIKVSDAPVIVSHANAKELYNHPRNLTDEQLRELKAAGGVIGLSCCPYFIASDNPTIEKLLDQFVHVAEVVGTEHLGIGSDFDGISETIPGLADVSALPRLVEGFYRRGFSEEEVEQITGGNFLRVWEQVLPVGSSSR